MGEVYAPTTALGQTSVKLLTPSWTKTRPAGAILGEVRRRRSPTQVCRSTTRRDGGRPSPMRRDGETFPVRDGRLPRTRRGGRRQLCAGLAAVPTRGPHRTQAANVMLDGHGGAPDRRRVDAAAARQGKRRSGRPRQAPEQFACAARVRSDLYALDRPLRALHGSRRSRGRT